MRSFIVSCEIEDCAISKSDICVDIWGMNGTFVLQLLRCRKLIYINQELLNDCLSYYLKWSKFATWMNLYYKCTKFLGHTLSAHNRFCIISMLLVNWHKTNLHRIRSQHQDSFYQISSNYPSFVKANIMNYQS